jgi:peptide/nickel transport system permease protein
MTIKYILTRLGIFALTIWATLTINFWAPRLAPGDPVQAMLGRLEQQGSRVEDGAKMVEAYRKLFGLDQPIMVQYGKYLVAMSRLEMGYSLAYFPSTVKDIIRNALPYTLGLLSVTTLVTFTLGILAGALFAWPKTPRIVRSIIPAFIALAPIPYYLLAFILIFVFGFTLKWFPASGVVSIGRMRQPGFDLGYILDILYHSILPALSIILSGIGGWALGMRGMMVTVLGEDYLTLAQAKGLPNRRVFLRYAVRNAMLPQFTGLAISLGFIVSGATLVELLFAYPGIGYQLNMSIQNSDYTVMQGITFILVASVALAILIIDMLYPKLDPRISYTRR